MAHIIPTHVQATLVQVLVTINRAYVIHKKGRAFAIVCLLMLLSCSMDKCRQWEMQEIVTQCPRFNGVRLLLSPDSDYSHLELELLLNSSGIYFFVNLLSFQARPCIDQPSRTQLEVLFDDKEPQVVYPYLLEGGQRLLLPEDIATSLIEALIESRSFALRIGRSKIAVVPTNFSNLYEQYF